MKALSKFRGTSGEVITDFISPFTYISALPVALVLLLLGWICNYFGEYRTYISFPVTSIFITIVTMRFALPASRGDMEPTNDLGEIIDYTRRYLLLNLAWYIPWFILWKLMSTSEFAAKSLILMNPMALMQSPWLLLFRVILVIIAVLMPICCLLISLHTHSVKGLFSAQTWKWLLEQRRDDLAPYMSHLIGGGFVMVLCALLPASILMYISYKDSLNTGMFVSGFLYLWIISTILILNGRLSGVFVAHDYIKLDFIEDIPLTTVVEAEPLAQVISPVESKPDFPLIEQRISGLDDSILPDAMAAASELETSMTAPIRGLIEQMLVAIRLKDIEAAGSFAAKAVDKAAQRGFVDISMKIFEMIGSERRKLKLSAYSFEILGNIYQQRKQLLDAAWCLHAAATASGDIIKAQKRLFQIAEVAEKSGNQKDALTLYEILIKQYPDSTLIEFAQQGASRLKNMS